ncbi:hypothetical protein N7645_15150 [Pseudomonas juntendi]|uniref:hypothetical protein n=1 Tax=Pseudomonas TaxID=286 RepID=UPI0012ADEB42|nr:MULTISPECIES: hypothetical protein [Pseudomonas]MDG9918225.1 hypothetical protein [Pseudomonas juntendi]MDH0507673.1 hypothetical protein [Pseudomonas juntendi]MDH1044845.1 hypothetical protein [Pseudomonas juntendi]MRT62341.1 hypothetical protein [Pseudomonas sp. CAH-1]
MTDKRPDFAELHKNLWCREQWRRRAIDTIARRLSIYQDAKRTLSVNHSRELEYPLDDILKQLRIIELVEAADLNSPIGPAADWKVEQLIVVPFDISPRFAVVRDGDIPEPWETRFGVYNQTASRLPEGCYAWDWQAFLRDWERKMAFLERERMYARLLQIQRDGG